ASADPLEGRQVRIDPLETVGELGDAEGVPQPGCEGLGAARADPRLDTVQVDRALVHARQPGAELGKARGGDSERDLDDVRALEMKRAVELEMAADRVPLEAVAENRHEVVAQ